MTNCPNCGAPINPRGSRCEYCGTWYVGADLAQDQDVVVNCTLFTIDGEMIAFFTQEIDRALSDPDYTQKGGL